jgi:cytidine deaminase
MKKIEQQFAYTAYDSVSELNTADQELMEAAKSATGLAYAPYSKFKVGAAARLANGIILKGSNQENASFPVGICAERVLLSVASSLYPNIPIMEIAISYKNELGNSDNPISPCGICRQSLLEFEIKTHQGIRLLLGGETGAIYEVPKAHDLLPLGFTSADLLAGVK